MTRRPAVQIPVRLLLDEMFSPAMAAALQKRGHDVVAVAQDPQLRSMSDEDLFGWAAQHTRRLVTENVKDFRRLLVRSEESERETAGLLFTSSRTFPRSRRNPRPLIDALDSWLGRPDVASRPTEDWLRPAADHRRR